MSKEKPAGHDREAEERCFAERYAAQPEREAGYVDRTGL